jgi:hypothetical protein
MKEVKVKRHWRVSKNVSLREDLDKKHYDDYLQNQYEVLKYRCEQYLILSSSSMKQSICEKIFKNSSNIVAVERKLKRKGWSK